MLRFSIGFVFGALLGASLALILAPQPGTETRRNLAQRARDVQEYARSLRRHRDSTGASPAAPPQEMLPRE